MLLYTYDVLNVLVLVQPRHFLLKCPYGAGNATLCVLWVLSVPLSMIFLLELRTVPTV